MTRLPLSRSLRCTLTSTTPCSCPRAGARCLARDPPRPRRPRGTTMSPEPAAWSAPRGSLTDPEYLRGGLGEDVAEEIEECPAGVPGPEPGLDEECAALHLPSFFIHAMTRPLPHAREMLRAPAGSRLILLGCSATAPRAVPSERDGRTGVGTRSWLALLGSPGAPGSSR